MEWTDAGRAGTPRQLRQFAAALSLVAAAWLIKRLIGGGASAGVWLLAAFAAGLGAAGLAVPRVVQPLYRAAMVAAFPIGWVMSRLALAVVFYVVLTPIALVMRASGRDVLHIRKTSSPSYWRPKPKAPDARRYLRQF